MSDITSAGDDVVSVPEDAEAESSLPGLVARGRLLRPAWRGLAAFLLFQLGSFALYAWPIAGDFAHRYIGVGKGDSKIYQWSLTWLPWAISHHQSPFYTTAVFAPDGVDLHWVTTLPGPALVMWPVTKAFGALVSYNLLLLGAPALAAWATYLLCYRVTRSFWPSVAGGYVFGFSTYVVAQMHGHVNLVLIFPAPLAAYLVVRWVKGELGTVPFVGLLTLDLAALFSISTETFATTALFGGIALLGAFSFGGALRWRIFRAGALVALSYVIMVALCSPFLITALRNAPEHQLRPPANASVDLLSFVVPRFSTLIGGQAFTGISSTFTANVVEDGAYLGIPLIVMLVWAGWSFRKSKPLMLLLGFVGLIAVLSLGPVLHIEGHESIPLPSTIIARLPLIKQATPQRFTAYMALGVAVVAAMWLTLAKGRTAWIRWGVVVLGALLLAPDVHSPPYHPTLRVPVFFTSGDYRQAIHPDEVMFAIPTTQGEELLWQSRSDYYFKLAQGYLGPIPPAYQGQVTARGLSLIQPHPYIPVSSDFETFLLRHRVTAIVVADAAESRYMPLLSGVGWMPTQVDDVWVWRHP
ncbi:MAG: hypothetical protein M3P11_11325 [Actinomycetota bacterium]|nr:hypothetical protein [Actinomycetota bacterium]